MKILRIVGSTETAKTRLVTQFVERLSEAGRVGTIEEASVPPDIASDGGDRSRYQHAGAVRSETITSDGTWVATDDDRTLTEALDALARSCDYAIVDGYPDATLPTVALGDHDHPDPIVTAPTAADVNVDAVVAALEETEPYETLASLVARAKSDPAESRAGAIATFTGRVRRKDSPTDTPTEYLEFERYDEVADNKEATIREELEARDGVYRVLLHHKTGVVDAGEDIVFVVVLAGHRTEAFETVEDGIDRLKEEVPLFKKEVTVDDEYWAHEH